MPSNLFYAQPASFPAFGVDTVMRITTADAAELRSLGYSFACRYLGSITEAELAGIVAGGLAVIPVTFSRKNGWKPTPGMGTRDANAAIVRARYVGVPADTTIMLDLEGCSGTPAQTSAWVNEWAIAIRAAGFDPGLYVGFSPGGLDAAGLWKLKVDRYWRAPFALEPDNCGACMYQLYPFNVKVAGVTVDVDAIAFDRKNRVPNWIVR